MAYAFLCRRSAVPAFIGNDRLEKGTSKERDLIEEAKKGKLATGSDDFSRLPFRDAAKRFLADRITKLAARSIQTERERVKPINKQIGNTPVRRVNVEQVRSYIPGADIRGKGQTAEEGPCPS